MHFNMFSFVMVTALVVVTSPWNINLDDNTCDCVCDDSPYQGDRIMGGSDARFHEFPFIVGLYDGVYLCAGAIITRMHVLTAAHCIKDFIRVIQQQPYRGKEINVLIGAHHIEQPTMIRKAVEMTYHAHHDSKTNNHDIAVVKMDKPVIFSDKVQAACLPFNDQGMYADNVGIVAGWGTTMEKGQVSKLLQKVFVPLIPNSECLKDYALKDIYITDNMICAGKGHKDACKGDSGGPLLALNTLTGVEEVIGVVSFGRGCGRPDFPGVYAKVNRYIKWIRQQLGTECLCVPQSQKRK